MMIKRFSALLSVVVMLFGGPCGAMEPPATASVRASDILWGQVERGLRAGIELVPEQPAYEFGQKVGVRVHLENVSDKPIVVASTRLRQDDAFEVTAQPSVHVPVVYREFTPPEPLENRVILPGRSIRFEATPLVFLSHEPFGIDLPAELRACNIATCRDGSYKLQPTIRLACSAFGTPTPGAIAWWGELEAAAREFAVGNVPENQRLGATGPKPGYRLMSFSGDHAVGIVQTRMGGTDRPWKDFAEAKGFVHVPPSEDIRLILGLRAGTRERITDAPEATNPQLALNSLLLLDDVGVYRLDVVGWKINEGAITPLLHVGSARELCFEDVPVPLKVLEYYGSFGNFPRTLRSLELRRCDITDAHLVPIGRLEALEELDLSGNQVTDQGLASLVSLKRLKRLDLSGNSVTETAIRSQLGRALPNCRIVRGETDSAKGGARP